jgi:uncharacterized protein
MSKGNRMLIEFKIKNYRSFHGETVISMVASSEKSLPENTRLIKTFGNRHLLQSAVIYGANAAGKTNLISAASFMSSFIEKSAERKIDTPIEIKPFMLTTEPNFGPTEFEVTFLDDENVRYQYGFRLNRDRILREWLVAYPKGLPQTWFERDFSDDNISDTRWYFGRNLKGQNNQIAEMTRSDVLFLSNAVKLNHKQLGRVHKWFLKSFRVIDASEFNPILYMYSAAKAKEDDHLKLEIGRLLEVADFGITGFDVKEETYSDQDFPEDMPNDVRKKLINKKHLNVAMHHSSGEKTQVSFPLEEESSGTQRFFSMSGPLTEVLENGWTLFVDELDSSLHPLLVHYLVKLFHNSKTNPKGAQLIFNTHDTTLMDSSLFRRDQIWFVEKDREGCSHLYSLLEYSPRKGESLAKGYLHGRYGGIPFFGELDWGETGHAEA